MRCATSSPVPRPCAASRNGVEDSQRGPFLHLAALGQDARAAATEDDPRAGGAADRVQQLVGARPGVARHEHERQIRTLRAARSERAEGRLERGVVRRPTDGEGRSSGDHGAEALYRASSRQMKMLFWGPGASTTSTDLKPASSSMRRAVSVPQAVPSPAPPSASDTVIQCSTLTPYM